jgi:hypothetical protein
MSTLPAGHVCKLRQLQADLVEAKQQYADLYETARILREIVEEVIGMLNTLKALHEKSS